MMTEQELRLEICRIGKSLFDRGYVHATAGNISVRLPEREGGGFLITPTDACLGFLAPETLAKLDSQGQQISGQKASKTIALHRSIYEASRSTSNPASCIIHTHSTHCVALTLTNQTLHNQELLPHVLQGKNSEKILNLELIPAITPYFVMKVGHVPLLAYQRPGAAQVASQAAQIIRDYAAKNQSIRALMLSRLGPNVWHETPAQAMAVLEELEETAKLWFLSPQTSPLNEAQIQELRDQFGAIW